jgi:hypothetical protein
MLGQQHLHCNFAAQVPVENLQDLSTAALAKLADSFVFAGLE